MKMKQLKKLLTHLLIKSRHNRGCGGDFSRPVSQRHATQWATEVAPTSAINLSNPLNLMAVTQERRNQRKDALKLPVAVCCLLLSAF